MPRRLWSVPAALLGSALIVAPVETLAKQSGASATAANGVTMVGGRAMLPSPGSGTGRNRTLLNRNRTLLPASPAPRAASGGTASNVNRAAARHNWTGSFGCGDRPVAETRCGIPNATDGLTVDGSYRDDRFKLKFHVGSGYDGNDGCHKPRYCATSCNTYCGYPLGWTWGWGWYDSTPYVVYSGPWYGTDPFVTQGQASAATPAAPAPAAAATQPTREPTLIERADEAWQLGRPDVAAGLLKEYLRAAPDDADALRYLALTLIDQRRVEEGVALMALAYEKLPQLASRPLPASAIPGGRDAMRKRVNAVSSLANQTRTASAWMTLAVLIQGEGRSDVARRILRRATAAGLSGSAAMELRAAMGD